MSCPLLQGQGFAIRDAGPDVLVIDRGAGFFCVVNASTESIEAPVVGDILVASDPDVMEEGGRITLPPSTGAWIQA